MGKTADEILQGLAINALKLDAKGVAELQESEGVYKDEALDFFLGKDAERITALQATHQQAITDKFNEGRRTGMEKLEKDLRAKYGYKDATKQGQELIDALIADAQLKAGNGNIDDKVKSHKDYLELEGKLAKVPKDIEDAVAQARLEERTVFEKAAITATVLEEASTLFDSLGVNLPDDATVAANQKRDFLDKFRAGTYQVIKKDGTTTIVPMNAEGKEALKDAHGHAITFEQLFKGTAAKYFTFKASEDKNTAPDPSKTGGTSSGGGSKPPSLASFEDYAKEHARLLTLPKAERTAPLAALKAIGKEKGWA